MTEVEAENERHKVIIRQKDLELADNKRVIVIKWNSSVTWATKKRSYVVGGVCVICYT